MRRVLRRLLPTIAGYLVLGVTVLAAAAPVGATHALDVIIYDPASCSGTAFGVTHEYNNLGSVGWNDRAAAIRSLDGGSSGRLRRDADFAGESFAFGNGPWSDCDLSNNFMAKWGPFDLYWNDQATSIEIT